MKYPRILLSVVRRPVLCLLAIWVVAAAAADEAPPPPKHLLGCPSRCGDVDIPYPFGIGDECTINPGFSLDCTRDVNGTDRPFAGPFEVTKISVPDSKAWMKMDISWRCYDSGAREMKESTPAGNFTYTPFRFSDDNKIYVIGCNSLAYITSEYYSIGCLSECYSDKRNTTSCSPGAGCCEADIPVDMRYCQPKFDPDYNDTTGCSYSVVMDAKAFSYSTTYRNSTTFWDAYNGRVPVVFDWSVSPYRGYTCEDAKRNISSYACVSDKSECVDITNGGGYYLYRCKCQNGYQGNPYIHGGCIGTSLLSKIIRCIYMMMKSCYFPFRYR